MATPTLTIRIAPEHHDTLRRIAAGLKADPGLPARLQAVLQPGTQPESEGDAPGVLARLEALEAAIAEMRPKVGRPRHGASALARAKAFKTDVTAFAKAQGVTVAELARRLATVTGNTVKSEEKALRGERPVSAEAEAHIRAKLGMTESKPAESASVRLRT